MDSKKFRFQDDFYENLGGLWPDLKNMSRLDRARFCMVSRFIVGESLLGKFSEDSTE